MSFLQQLDGGEAPALTLEETLAFLDAFDDAELSGCTSSGDCSGSATSSPGYDCGGGGQGDDELDDLLSTDSTATTTVGCSSGSERSWSDAEECSNYKALLSGPPAPGASAERAPIKAPPVAASQRVAKPQPKPRQKRKAAQSATASPRGASKATAGDDMGDDGDEALTATTVKRRSRKQPKTEILRLRDQVEELQARLTQLQKAGGGPSSNSGGLLTQMREKARGKSAVEQETASKSSAVVARPAEAQNASMWLDRAVDQYKALQKSEALNAKLKTEVKRQASLGKTLKALFTKKTAQQGLDFVTELEPPKSSGAGAEGDNLWTKNRNESDADADLYKSVEDMHIEADFIQRDITSESDAGSVFSSSKTKQDKVFGPVFEIKTNTPVGFKDFRQVAHLFWKRMLNASDILLSHPENGRPSTANNGYISKDIHERPVSMKLLCRQREVVLSGVAVMCKVEEAHRSVFTFAATLAVAEHPSLVFREYGWMIVAPFETDTSNSLFQTFYRLHTEKRTSKKPATSSTPESSAAADADEAALQAVVMKTLSDNMRSFQHEIQNSLLTEMNNFSNVQFTGACPLQRLKLQMQG